MKFTVVIVITIFTLFISSGAYAKNKDLMRAQYYYSVNKFHDAIPYFEKIVDDENDPELYGQLGDCYRLTSKIKIAADWYSKAVHLEGCRDEIILRYAQALMELMNYDTAKKYLTDYQSRNMSDRRITNLINGCNSAPEVLVAKPKGKTIFLNINTNGSEFAPTIWKNNLVFAADVDIDLERKRNKIEDFTKDKMYYVQCDKNGNTAKTLKRLSIKGIDKDDHVGPATFSADGKKMYFTTSKSEQSNDGRLPSVKDAIKKPLEIWIASDLDTTSNEFQTIKPFKYNSIDYSVAQPSISPDGKMLLFTSDMPGGEGGSDIYICKLGDDGEWTKPMNAGHEVNTEGEEVFPFFSDYNTLFFSSDGHQGIGGLDVYMSKWNEGTSTFSNPVNLGTPINSSYDDISLALFADLRSSYFSSNRPALKGGDNIYFFNRTHAFLHLKLFDEITNNPLNVANVSIESYGNKQFVTVDKYGELVAQVYNDIYYKVNVTKNGYIPKSVTVNCTKFAENDTVDEVLKLMPLNITKDSNYEEQNIAGSKRTGPEPVLVKNEPPVTVRDSSYYRKPSYVIMTIIDSFSKRPLKNATISLQSGKDDREIETNEKGKTLTQLIPEIRYSLLISKTGYKPREITLKTIFGRDEADTFYEEIALLPLKIAKTRNHDAGNNNATTDAGEDESTEPSGKRRPAGKHGEEIARNDHAGNAKNDHLGSTKNDHSGSTKNELADDAYEPSENKDVNGKSVSTGSLVSLKGYYAEYNKSEIVESRKYILDRLLKQLKDHPTMKIRILGHADCRGTAAYNMKLSIQRAIEVGKYLVSQGIDPRRLQHKGLGVAKPVVKCPVCNECNEDQHEKNRGFEYVVLHK